MTTPGDRGPGIARDAFVREVEEAMRAEGLEGPVDYEPLLGTLVHASGIGFDVHSLYESIKDVPDPVRRETVRVAVRALLKQVHVPDRWADAKEAVLPVIQPRMAKVLDRARRSPHEDAAPGPSADITAHLVLQVVYPTEGVSLPLHRDAFTTWDVDPETVVQAAVENLAVRTKGQWKGSPKAPGVYRSPWADGFDASRLLFPQLFGQVPVRGRPVALAPTPFQLYFAGSDDEEGLFHLARLARAALERERRFHFLRTVRMREDGASWEDWLPPPEHPVHAALRLLRALEESRDYEAEANLLQRPGHERLPGLDVHQSTIGDMTLTTTVWRAGAPRQLPKADRIVFEQEGKLLGTAAWDDVAEGLPGELEPLRGYPPRFAAVAFPEPWALARLRLEPWER